MYCYACGQHTEGEPLFCNFCGKSYDQKLCPRLHANPRNAEVCSQCGSRDLSTPQPMIPMSWRLGALLLRLGVGLLLFYVSLQMIIALFRAPEFQELLVLLGVMLAGLWFLFTRLPDWLQDALRSLWSKEDDDG